MGDTRFDGAATAKDIAEELGTIGAQPVDRLIINLIGMLHRVSGQLADVHKELSTLQGLVPRMAAVEERLAHPDARLYTDLIEGEQERRRREANNATQQQLEVEVARAQIRERTSRRGMYLAASIALATPILTILARALGWS